MVNGVWKDWEGRGGVGGGGWGGTLTVRQGILVQGDKARLRLPVRPTRWDISAPGVDKSITAGTMSIRRRMTRISTRWITPASPPASAQLHDRRRYGRR